MSLDAADLAAFVDEDMPGYVLATLSGGDVPGLFGSHPVEAFGIAHASHFSFRAVSTSVSAVAVGDAITINGASFSVAERMPNGNGMTLLLLKT